MIFHIGQRPEGSVREGPIGSELAVKTSKIYGLTMPTISPLRPLPPEDLHPDEVKQWIKLVACRDPWWWTEEHLELLICTEI